jgi:hypothetical protein
MKADDKFDIANPNGKENGDKELKRNIQLLLFLKMVFDHNTQFKFNIFMIVSVEVPML